MTDNQSEGDGIVVWLGNRQAIEVIPHPDEQVRAAAAADAQPIPTIRRALPGNLCTTFHAAPDLGVFGVARDITTAGGVWSSHSDDDAPAWVASTNPLVAQILADHYGCELRDPNPDDGGEA